MKENNNILETIPVAILAGGQGIRLGLNYKLIPKPMVEINGKPLLFYIMNHYAQAGFRKFIICGGLGAEAIKEFISQGCCSAWDINLVDTGVNSMTGSRLAQIKPLVESAPFFCLTYGDTACDVSLNELLSFHRKHKKMATVLAVHVPTRFRIFGLYGDDNLVKGFAEKPILQIDYINGGFYVFNKSLLSLASLRESLDCVLENEVLEELSSRKELFAFKYDGFWQCLDTERDLKKLRLRFK